MELSSKRNRGIKQKIGLFLAYTLATFLAVIFLFPFYYSLINALRPIISSPAILKPKGFEWINFKHAVTMIPFFKYFWNTILIEVIGLSTSMFTTFMYGYALARLRAPGKTVVFYMILSSMMVPAMAIQIPQFVLFSTLGIKDTYWIYVINGIAGSSIGVFTYKQYLADFPRSIEEAARIDGCSWSSLMFRVVLPTAKPIIAVILFREFLSLWNDYMTPYMYLSRDKYPLSVALFGVTYVLPSNPTVKFVPVQTAASILIAIPPVIVFFLVQKKLVSGTMSGGVKG